MHKFLENDAVKWRENYYRCHPITEVPEAYFLTDMSSRRFLVWENELETSLEAEMQMVWAEENSRWPTPH
jgi:hypothetical protein